LADVVAATSPDVVHAHGYDADYWAAAARWRHPRLFQGRSLVFTQHGVVEDTIWHRGKTLLDAICMRAADGVVVCGADLAGRMQRWCPRGSVQYIPNGVSVPDAPPRDEARHSLGLPTDGHVVGYVGRLSPEKRPDRVLELVADVRAAGLPVTSVIVGSGPLRAELEQQVEKLGVRDAVIFTGLVRDVGHVYAALDALVLLSDTETTSRVVIEAMTTGVPVVASDVGGVPELLDQGRAGYLVAPEDRTAAVGALVDLLRGPDRFVDVARKRAKELYVVDVMGRRVIEFYQSLRARAAVPGGISAHDAGR
jgi:glycosyltransferase involved in cell wall biosynthesis